MKHEIEIDFRGTAVITVDDEYTDNGESTALDKFWNSLPDAYDIEVLDIYEV